MSNDLREDHFDSAATPDHGAAGEHAEKDSRETEVLREDEVDEEFFAFPN